MKTPSSKMIKVDVEKLAMAFADRNRKPTNIAADLGLGNGYFSNVKQRGVISPVVVVALESRFGIPREEYIIPDEPEPQNQLVEVISTTDDFFSDENQQKLYKLIYSAVYGAVSAALNE